MAALFLGAALAAFSCSLFRAVPLRKRRNLLSLALVLVSLALAAFTPSVIMSNWAILFDHPVLYCSLFLFLIFFLSFRFPVVFGLPLLVITGVFIVYASVYMSRFPSVANDEAVLAQIRIEMNGETSVKFLESGPKKYRNEYEYFDSVIYDNELVFTVSVCCIAAWVPWIGMESRASLAEVIMRDQILYPRISIPSAVVSTESRGFIHRLFRFPVFLCSDRNSYTFLFTHEQFELIHRTEIVFDGQNLFFR